MIDPQAIIASLRRKTAEKTAAMVAEREARAAENRRRMPGVTAAVDQYRDVFGDVRVAWASEGGATIGSPSPAGVKLSENLHQPVLHRLEKKSEKELTSVTVVI